MNDFNIQDGVFLSYQGREEACTVPEGVHTIAQDAFKACISLKKIVLPHSLRHIMPRAFKGCRNLSEFEIPEGVSDIGDYAFHRCHSLKSIRLPASVKELGNCVFLYCDSLQEVHIPGVCRLGSQVFLNDTLLEKIEISRELQEDCIRDVFTSCGRISEISFADGEVFLLPSLVEAAAGEPALPSLIQKIAADVLTMFELDGHCLVRFLTNLRHVEIPEGITQIGKSCFFDRRGIISITLPTSLKEIQSRAFRNCISLEQVVFKTDEILVHEDAFKNCTSLKQIFLPANKEVLLPDGNIEPSGENSACREFSLRGLSALSQQGVPELVRTICGQVLENFRLCGTILLKYLGNESRVVVPEGITAIAEEAFAGKESIDRLILPEGISEIGKNAFRGCLLLQTVKLPSTLKRIGEGAFENCVKLIRLILPNFVTTIAKRTFCRCKSLVEIYFNSNLCEIGEQAFYGCTSLSEVRFPHTLTHIETMAFYRCSALKNLLLPKHIDQIGNLAFAQSGVQEARISGNGSKFGADLFAGCTHLSILILEEGVCHIPDKLAFGCTALTNVKLPDSLESIGRNAFDKTPFLTAWKQEFQNSFLADGQTGCEPKPLPNNGIFWDGSDLEGEVRLSDQTKIIAGGAFYGNTKITFVWTPDSVRQIGNAALKGCSALLQFRWPTGLSRAEDEVFSGCTCLRNIENAPDWQFIGNRAFYHCTRLGSLSILQAESIGDEAFYRCFCLERFPASEVSAKYIGEDAFFCTPVLEDQEFDEILSKHNFIDKDIHGIYYEPTEKTIGSFVVEGNFAPGSLIINKYTDISPYAFFQNDKIKGIRLMDSVSCIGEGAFLGCQNLAKITFPENDIQIKARAFEKCTKLEEITLRRGSFGKSAFTFCTRLKRVSLTEIPVLEEHLFEGCSALEEFSCDFPEATLEIKTSCFSGCRKLSHIDLRNVQKIAPYAFENCDSLQTITLSENAFLEAHAFQDCSSLTEICILGNPAKLKLQEYAFSGCTALKRVVAGGSVWEFSCYHDIYSSDFPQAVRMIFYSAFSCFDVEKETILCGYHGCARAVHIPEGIRRIEAEVFYDVLMLEEIHIPESVEYIGARAFYKTAWLKQQQQLSPMVMVNHMLVDASCCLGEVTIPEDTRLICGWAFANGLEITKIRFLSAALKVEPFAFRNCIYLEEIMLPDGESIRFEGISDRNRELPPLAKQVVLDRLNCFKTDENGVLVECTGNISRLLVADGITAIGAHAFLDSNLLTELTLPASVTAIGDGAFMNCKWLKTVRQPASAIRKIGGMAFSGCGTLETIELSNALTTIGIRAFEHCTSLREILLPEGLEEIPDRAFFRCHSLQHVQLPSTLKRIGKEAFAFCRQLSISSLPAGVTVEERAFVGTKI